MKHPMLNGGQRPVGLDQDSCIYKKKSEAFEAQRGQRPVGLDQDRTQTPKVNGDSLVKKRSRHMDAMTNPKLNGRQSPVEELRL